MNKQDNIFSVALIIIFLQLAYYATYTESYDCLIVIVCNIIYLEKCIGLIKKKACSFN